MSVSLRHRRCIINLLIKSLIILVILYPSLPLDRAGRLRRHVVDDAVDALDLVDDARRGAAEEAHVEGIEVRGHAVVGCDGAKGADEIVRAAVAHDADGAHRQEHCKRLPDRVVEPGLPDLVEVDGVGLPEDRQLLARDRAGDDRVGVKGNRRVFGDQWPPSGGAWMLSSIPIRSTTLAA